MGERGLEVRAYTEADIPGICTLFLECFHKELRPETFRWKYAGAPWGSRGYVAAVDGNIVSFYGGLGLAFRFKGKGLRAFQFCDVMTHPKCRKMFFSKTPLVAMLGDEFYRSNPMDFAYGFPSVRHARLQALRLEGEGYRMVQVFRKTIAGADAPAVFSAREGWDYFDPADSLFPEPGSGGGLQLLKDGNYLSWRYRDNPTGDYRFLRFRRFFSRRGSLVFSVSDRWLKIMEIFPAREKDLASMLQSLEAYTVRNYPQIDGIMGWFHPDEPAAARAADLGYKAEDAVPVAFKSVNVLSGVDAGVFYGTYFYRMGDYDAA